MKTKKQTIQNQNSDPKGLGSESDRQNLPTAKTESPNTTAQPAPAGQPKQAKPAKPYVNFEERERNRQLPTERVLELLKRWMPRQFEIAEVVGKWIWIQFAEPPAETVRAELSQLGFHWNNKRQAWQHPCGHVTAGTNEEPRAKYASYFPADRAAA